MKALLFITRLDLGGAQETCLDQCRWLLERGHEVHLLTAGEGELLADARRIPGLVVHAWDGWNHEIRPLQDTRCFARLVRMLRGGGFDLLHTHSSKAGIVGRLAAWIARRPQRVVHHIHGWSFNDTQPPLKRRAYVLLEKLAARPGFVLLACSHETEDQGRRAGIGRDADRRVVYYGIDRSENLRRRNRAAIRSRLGIGRREVLFLQLGNLKPQKDPVTLARAAVLAGRRLPRARFWIAGDGPLREETLAVAGEGGLGDRFRVLGWRRDVPDLLAAADVMVLTSLFEGMPLAILRAMAAGLPVVATAVDGSSEAIDHGHTGLLVAPGNTTGIAHALVRLGSDPMERRRMGRAGRARSARFAGARAATATMTLYGIGPGATDSRPFELPGGRTKFEADASSA
jgi:glycosyltransferase involved in cell wall biosynthesis